jgi:hypothetical protein
MVVDDDAASLLPEEAEGPAEDEEPLNELVRSTRDGKRSDDGTLVPTVVPLVLLLLAALLDEVLVTDDDTIELAVGVLATPLLGPLLMGTNRSSNRCNTIARSSTDISLILVATPAAAVPLSFPLPDPMLRISRRTDSRVLNTTAYWSQSKP